MLDHRARVLALAVLGLTASGPAWGSLTLLPAGPQIGNNSFNNLVTNGSFENGAPPVNGPIMFWATGTTNLPFGVPGGWTSSGAPSTYANWGGQGTGPYTINGSAPLPDGSHGLYFGNFTTPVDQTPTWQPNRRVTFPAAPNFTPVYGQPCTLSQTVPTHTTIAPSYILSFWASGENASFQSWSDGIFGLRVTNVLPGDPIHYLTVPGGTTSFGTSIRYEFQFTPLNPLAPVDIEFINWGHLTGYPDASGSPVSLFTTELVLDDVIVNPVIPAPGAGLVLAALAPLAATRRRRGA
jgi:hypothetical protein